MLTCMTIEVKGYCLDTKWWYIVNGSADDNKAGISARGESVTESTEVCKHQLLLEHQPHTLSGHKWCLHILDRSIIL